ncbi:MAG: hypothetical protein ACYC8T_18640 [Myxococcaceae bacterium]
MCAGKRLRGPLGGARAEALPPSGLQHCWKTAFATKLTDGAIKAHLEHGPKVPVVNSTVHIYPINIACNGVAPDATVGPNIGRPAEHGGALQSTAVPHVGDRSVTRW